MGHQNHPRQPFSLLSTPLIGKGRLHFDSTALLATILISPPITSAFLPYRKEISIMACFLRLFPLFCPFSGLIFYLPPMPPQKDERSCFLQVFPRHWHPEYILSQLATRGFSSSSLGQGRCGEPYLLWVSIFSSPSVCLTSSFFLCIHSSTGPSTPIFWMYLAMLFLLISTMTLLKSVAR